MKSKNSIVLTAVIASALAISSFAAGTLVSIDVDPSIKILVNGEEFHPKDANGNDVMTFTYNGTTYAPLRALAEAYGLEVGYDSSLKMAMVDGGMNTVREIGSGTVIYDSDYAKIKFEGLIKDEEWFPNRGSVRLCITNKTDKEISVDLGEVSINGYSYTCMAMSNSIAPNSSKFINYRSQGDPDIKPYLAVESFATTVTISDGSLFGETYDSASISINN